MTTFLVGRRTLAALNFPSLLEISSVIFAIKRAMMTVRCEAIQNIVLKQYSKKGTMGLSVIIKPHTKPSTSKNLQIPISGILIQNLYLVFYINSSWPLNLTTLWKAWHVQVETTWKFHRDLTGFFTCYFLEMWKTVLT